jgi:predicted nucleic acid-binding protein
MKAAVVDASVIAAALFSEPYNREARDLLTCGIDLYAPDLVYAEVGNVVWKRYHRREIDAHDAADLLNDVLSFPLMVSPSKQLALPALELATRTGRTVYDCLYVVLAVQTKAVLVSNDRRLVNALSSGPLRQHISWLGAVGPP